MGMTMTQKILAAHAGLPTVSAGELIEAELDLVLGNDITSPVAIHEMDKMKAEGVFDRDKIALVLDHFVPNKDIKSAQHCKCVREFACKHEITNYFDVGQMGIEHALLPEKGLTVAGDVIIGADSHTCTYVYVHVYIYECICSNTFKYSLLSLYCLCVYGFKTDLFVCLFICLFYFLLI